MEAPGMKAPGMEAPGMRAPGVEPTEETQPARPASAEIRKTVHLTDAISTREKLVIAANLSSQEQEKETFVPLLTEQLESLGSELSVTDFASLLLRTAKEFITAIHGSEKGITSSEGISFINHRLPVYVDALINDPEIAMAVKKEIEDMNVLVHLSAKTQK